MFVSELCKSACFFIFWLVFKKKVDKNAANVVLFIMERAIFFYFELKLNFLRQIELEIELLRNKIELFE